MPRISYLFLLILTSISTAQKEDVRQLFSPSREYTILGPSTFPKPSDAVSEDAVVVLKPTFGKHRADQDAVLAYAEGYDLVNYLIFIETLRQTGFDGDIVLAIAALDQCKDGVVDYLRAQDHVVVYAVNFTCSTDKFQTTTERVQDNGNKMSFQMCKLNGIYGLLDATATGGVRAVDDPRRGRVVATSRYELYWIWSLQYNSHSWLMLLDSRDSYFQSNPFANLKRTTDPNVRDGVLHFFGVSFILCIVHCVVVVVVTGFCSFLHVHDSVRTNPRPSTNPTGKHKLHSTGQIPQESQMVGTRIQQTCFGIISRQAHHLLWQYYG